MAIVDLICKKRFGGKHTSEEIRDLVNGYVSGEIADYQMSAWLMAVCINGLDIEETVALTEAMVASGETIDLSSLPGITVDKHSTGGVGDKTTLVLAPLLAAAGLTVAKMSGRGLGITGGTLDKLESIPGFNTRLTKDQFLNQARQIGCVLAGQTGNLVPADKKMYALRDVTSTVESIPLIAASVMSKKIASGASTILLDVKVGSGAFMKDLESARKLAETMILIGKKMGRKVIVAITGMNQPLGYAVGNTIEVEEAIDTLKGNGPDDLTNLCIELGALLLAKCHSQKKICHSERSEESLSEIRNPKSEMICHSERSEESILTTTRSHLNNLLSSNRALEVFREVIEAQGGDPRVIDDPSILPQPKFQYSLIAASSGYVQSVDACTIGRAAGMLGAGREKKEDQIDPTAGVLLRKKIGDLVEAGEELALLQTSKEINVQPILSLVESAFIIGSAAPTVPPLIQEIIGFD